MTLVDYTLETGGEGTTATTVNTGGAQQITPGTGGTIQYRAASAAPGHAFGLQFKNGSGNACVGRWNASASNNQMAFRFVCSGPYGATPTAEVFIANIRHTGGNVAQLRWQTNNSCNFTDQNGTVVGTILPTGSDPTIKYQWTLVLNNSTGAYTLKCYSADGNTLLNTLSGTRTWSATTVLFAVQAGMNSTHTQLLTVDFDALSMNDGSSTEIAPITSGVTVNAVASTATAAALAPVVSGNGNGTVTGVAATSTARMWAPTVEGESVITGGGAASASAAMVAPTVSATRSATVVGVAATATALAAAPVLTSSPTVTAVAATATAALPAPVISATRNPTVVAVAATASALALPPGVSAGGSITIATPAATASATAVAPSVSAVQNPTVVAVAATATSAAPAPVVSSSASVTAPAASASLAALAPTVTGTSNATVQAVAAQANAQALEALVTGSGSAGVSAVAATATALMLAPSVIGIDATAGTPAERIYIIAAEQRRLTIAAESRRLEVPHG